MANFYPKTSTGSTLNPKITLVLEHIFNAILLLLVSLIVMLMELINASINIVIRSVPLNVVLTETPYRMTDGEEQINDLPSETTLGAISKWMFLF